MGSETRLVVRPIDRHGNVRVPRVVKRAASGECEPGRGMPDTVWHPRAETGGLLAPHHAADRPPQPAHAAPRCPRGFALTDNAVSSTGPAIFVGGWALAQLWLFWVAPIAGAAIAGFFYRSVLESDAEAPPVTGRVQA